MPEMLLCLIFQKSCLHCYLVGLNVFKELKMRLFEGEFQFLQGKNITHSSTGIGVLIKTKAMTGDVSEAYYQDVKFPFQPNILSFNECTATAY
jgi:hypothetical protein